MNWAMVWHMVISSGRENCTASGGLSLLAPFIDVLGLDIFARVKKGLFRGAQRTAVAGALRFGVRHPGALVASRQHTPDLIARDSPAAPGLSAF